MSFVETETNGQIFVIRLNRPERLNALSTVIREGLAEAFTKFHDDTNLEIAILTEMAFGFRINAERMYQVGFVNRLVEQENLMKEAHSMAKHLLSLPPASRVNTLYMMKHMAPKLPSNITNLAEKLHLHGDTEDRMESRRAFAEKREPNYKGWLNPDDR